MTNNYCDISHPLLHQHLLLNIIIKEHSQEIYVVQCVLNPILLVVSCQIVHRHDIAEISLKVALNTIPPQIVHFKIIGIRIDNSKTIKYENPFLKLNCRKQMFC